MSRKRASEKLNALRTKLLKKEKGEKLTLREARALQRISTDVRNTLMAETKGQFVYVATDKRLDARKLLDGVAGLFAPGVFDSFSESAV